MTTNCVDSVDAKIYIRQNLESKHLCDHYTSILFFNVQQENGDYKFLL